MAFFASETTRGRYIALLDIGSASVTASLAYSEPEADVEIIWSTCEYVEFKYQKTRREIGKRLMSAFTNCVLELGQQGFQVMRERNSSAHIDSTQVSVAAPWSYTVTKHANYNKDKSFIVTNGLYRQLLDSLETAVSDDLAEHEAAQELGLEIVSRSVTAFRVNGYNATTPSQQEATSVDLTLSSTIIQNYLYDVIEDAHNKVLVRSELQTISFVLMLYHVLQDIHPEMREYCIINQTMEATEIAVIRNGELTYSTHEPYGIMNLTRDLSEAFGVPVEDMYGAILGDHFQERYNATSTTLQRKVDAVLSAYHQTIGSLMHQTGDGFTIPKSLYVHTSSCTYQFLSEHITQGAKQLTGLTHIAHNVDRELLRECGRVSDPKSERSCVEIVSAYYAHTQGRD